MSNKRDPRYITLATGAEMKLNLDPDIYDADTCTLLGISSADPTGATVPVTVAQAAKSTAVRQITCRIEKGAGDTLESRRIKLLCENSKLIAALAAFNGGTKTLKIGGLTPVSWNVVSAS